jgi:hypothetical protein
MKANNTVDNLKEKPLVISSEEAWKILDKHENEIIYTVQEWGLKNNLRLIGYCLCPLVNPPVNGKYGKPVPTAKVLFTDLDFKTVRLLYFIVTEKNGKVSVAQDKTGFQYPIKVLKTGNFITKHYVPISPVYNLLIEKGIIFPFEGTIKNKKWQAMPFEDGSDIKVIAL